MKSIRGYATVEFALVSSVFFAILFGVFEIGRLLFLWNTLTESTRRGARVAVICPIEHPSIKQAALFNENNNTHPILPNMSPADFKLEYLNESGSVLLAPQSNYLDIRFVRFSIAPGQQVNSSIPGLSQLLELPAFSTVLPIESLGVSRDDVAAQCQGTAS